jgi:hypothetical protein
VGKHVVRDLAPDPTPEPMHDGAHETGALLGCKDRDSASRQTNEDKQFQNDAPD